MRAIRVGTLLAVPIAAALAAAACGGDDEDTAAERTTTTSSSSTTTTEPPTPEQAFLADVDDQMSFGDDSGPTAALSFADGVCDFFVTLDETTAGNPDLAQTETDELVADAVETWLGEIGDDASGVLVMRLAGEHLCPEHADAIERGIASVS